MSTQDLISIVIPVYNGEKFLRENVECILEQTYKNLEIIYICDGCTDHTVDILRGYSSHDSRIIIHVKGKNHGAAVARNMGMAMASGDWIIFLDSDDLFAKDMIEVLLEYAVSEKADVCCCFWEQFNENPVYDGYIANDGLKQYCKTYPVINVKEQKKNILQLIFHPPWNKLISKEVYRKKDVYFQNLPNCDDAYFSYVVAMEATTIAYVDRVLIYYRDNKDRRTLSTNQNDKKNFVWDAYDEVYRYICQKENGKELKQSFYNKVCEDVYSMFGNRLYLQLFGDLYNIYFDKWEMGNSNVVKKLSYFNQEVYKKIFANDSLLEGNELILRAEESFVCDIARTGACSIWGCGYKGEKLLERLGRVGIDMQHVFDLDPSKWGMHIHGRVVEGFVDDGAMESIIVTSPKYYEEIRTYIGNRAKSIYNLAEEIYKF